MGSKWLISVCIYVNTTVNGDARSYVNVNEAMERAYHAMHWYPWEYWMPLVCGMFGRNDGRRAGGLGPGSEPNDG